MKNLDSKDLLQEISHKLNVLIALCVEQSGRKILIKDSVKMLIRLGITDDDIAAILGTSKATVQVLKSRHNIIKK